MDSLLNSLEYGLPSAVIVLVFLTINKFIDFFSSKERNKKEIKINNEIIDCFNNINSFLQHITKDIIEKDNNKCSFAIRTAFKSMSYSLIRFATFTIINNNVQDNRKNIEDNINSIVEQEYSNLYNCFILYHTDKNQIVDYLSESWKQELKDDLKNIIFDSSLNKDSRIYTIHNKIGLKIDNYQSYINNKFLEND